MPVNKPKTLLCAAALAVAALGACAEPPETQTLSGRLSQASFDAPLEGVRAVQDGTVVATAAVAADGSFSIEVPPGNGYRLQVVTRAGAHDFVRRTNGSTRIMSFDVCDADTVFEMGDVDYWDSDQNGEGEGSSDPGEPDWDDPHPNCDDPEPPPCADPNDADCWPPTPCDPSDPDCGGIDPCNDPSDPNCLPPDPCDGDPNCVPPDPCDGDPDCWPPDACDPNDPDCWTDPCDNGDCWPPQPCEDPSDPNCWTDPCADPGDPDCWTDPCDDPSDPDCWTDPCENGDPADCDPCRADPANCWPPDGCEDSSDPNSCWPDDPDCPYDDPSCWPDPIDPEPCEQGSPDPDANGQCWSDPDDGVVPEFPFPDFGCFPDN